MSRKNPKTFVPSYRHHKPSDQGIVEFLGNRIYLGPWDDPNTQERYHQLIAEWLSNGEKLPPTTNSGTIVELCAAYWERAKAYYVRADGTPTTSLQFSRAAIRELRRLYGNVQVTDFGPKSLRAVRNQWVERDLARKTVNEYTAEVKRIFKWGVSEELVPEPVYRALITVPGLRAGRGEARETQSVKPVPDDHIDAIEPFVSRQVWALIQLQLLTAARSGELIALRAIDLDTSESVWSAKLFDHKMSHRGVVRIIYFGPRAQDLLRPFMSDRAVSACLFSPQDAENERFAKAATHRRSGQSRNDNASGRTLGEHYTVNSYYTAIRRGCVKANIPHWHPHQLRHNAATRIRKEFGLEAAQVMLGHAKADVTQLYAEVNRTKAINVVREIG